MRDDYLPFGEEIGAGVGLRTSGQGHNAIDNSRQKFALTERDSVTGLDHTWFRKYESLAGRWTSPDPLVGNIANPQSFNRYSYVNNDPVNFVDPTGLYWVATCELWALFDVTDPKNPIQIGDAYLKCSFSWVPEYGPVGGGDPGGGGRVGPQRFQHPRKTPTPPGKTQKQKAYDDCFTREMKGPMKGLEKLMYRNLKYTLTGGAIGSLGGVLGAMGGLVITLDMWRDAIQDYEDDTLGPAREAAKEKCKKEAGL